MSASITGSRIRCSWHQERLWFIDSFETENVYPAQPTYHNIPLLLYFEEPVDRAQLEKSINAAIRRHEVLRTRIVTENDVPLQVISDSLVIDLRTEECPGVSYDPGDPGQVERFLEASRGPLPLDGEALLTARLSVLADDRSILLLTVHHIIADRRSIGVLAAEIVSEYEALRSGHEPGATAAHMQYADFSEWQRGLLPEDWEPYNLYWKKQLAGALQALELPTDRPRAPIQTYRPVQIQFPVEHQLYRKLEQLGTDHGLAVQDVLLGAYVLLLHRYAGLAEINVGCMLPNRRQVDTDAVVGPLANLVALRTRVEPDATVARFFGELQRVVRDAAVYQELPYEKLVLDLAPTPDMSRTALFDVLFQFETATPLPAMHTAVTRIESNYGLGKYDLNLLLKAHAAGSKGYLVFNAAIYDGGTMRRFIAHYKRLLESLAGSSGGAVHELEMVGHEEQALLKHAWNDTTAEYPKAETIVSLFEHAAAAWAERTAVENNGTAMTYAELNECANRMSHWLAGSHGVKSGDRIAISLDKSLRMTIAVVAVLKAGAAYVPIDPAYPPRRMQYIIEDTGCSLLLADREVEPVSGLTAIDLREVDCGSFSSANGVARPVPEDLAYIIYTSGSTGVPKGCEVSHRNVVRLMMNDRHDFVFNELDTWIMAHSLSFDFSVWEIWGALLYGGKLLLPAPTENIEALYQEIVKGRVTVLNQTPDAFYVLGALALDDHTHDLSSHLRYVVFGGAKLDPTRLKSWSRRYPLDRICLVNMYGITETTVHVTFHRLRTEDIEAHHPVSIIGRPLPETQVFILDPQGHLSPIGVWGEIHVGGSGVARGYLNQPELTQTRFVARPDLAAGRLYASGDIGRWVDGGIIEYLGRRDGQIKIRGFRIESAEVAFYLKKHPTIADAIVVSRLNPDSETGELVAYYVPERSSNTSVLSPATLREHLTSYLPAYMIPSLFVPVPRIPLNNSGKVDVSALPSAGSLPSTSKREVASPRNPNESVMAAIWERCLSRPFVGIHDNYFDLGGHSLTAARIAAEVGRTLGLEMRLSDIFSYPTVAQLVEYLAGQARPAQNAPVREPDREAYTASPAQRRIWTHGQFDLHRNLYNVTAAFRLRGDLDCTALGGAIEDLMARHESLRTYLTARGAALEQRIATGSPSVLRIIDFSGQTMHSELAREWIRQEAAAPFDLSKAPLLRAAILKMVEREHLFVFTIHHVISDGWSLKVLQRELGELYRARLAGEPCVLPPLPYQYKDYAAWHLRELASSAAEQLRGYWNRKLAPPLPSNGLRAISAAAGEPGFEGKTLTFSFGPEPTAHLRALAKAHSGSLFMVLLTYVKLLLFKYSGESDTMVGTPAAGRELPGLEDQIGCYVNMLPLRDTLDASRSFGELLEQVRQTVLDAFDHQMYPIEAMAGDRGATPGTNTFFDVAVMMLDHSAARLAFPGIEVIPVPLERDVSLYDLVFEFVEGGDTIVLNLSYRTALFRKARIERLWSHLETLVAQGLANPGTPVRNLEFLSTEESAKLRSLAASARREPTLGSTLVEAFEAACALRPEQRAVVADAQSVTYAELNRRADALAHSLTVRHGLQSGDLVGLLFEPSIDAIAAVLGVLKAGAAYLPLDPGWPSKRTAHILNDSGCRLLLCGDGLQQTARQSAPIPVLVADEALFAQQVPENGSPISPGQPAYVIYTSGSTGGPKGVLVEHRSVLNLIDGLNACLYRAHPERLQIACLASLVFDASVQQIFASLLLGHTLHMVPDAVKRNPAELIALLRARAIDVLDLTPSLFRMLLRIATEEDLAPALKRLIIGGEALPSALVNAFYANRRNRQVVITNVYGPTEATVDVLWHDCPPGTGYTSIPVGRPLPNTRIYLLDGSGRPVALGDSGEICIAGAGLARGYIGALVQVGAGFMSADSMGEDRIYRTGDLGRWNAEGDLEFLGRIDRQVKVRGHRIELEEIETRLLQHPDVQAAVVAVTGEDENQDICAWVVGAAPFEPQRLELYLREHLPSYMVPSCLLAIPAVPLNSSGKVDMAALSRPGSVAVPEHWAAGNATEAALVAIWAGVLRLDEALISRKKTFFELGGNSLTSVYVVAEIQERLNVSLRLTDFYRQPDIVSLARLVDARKNVPAPSAPQTVRPIRFELTFPQKRVWIECEKNPAGTAYHMPGSLALGPRSDPAAIRGALYELVRRHDALRLHFSRVGYEILQSVGEPVPPPLTVVDISGEPNPEAARRHVISETLLAPFDLDRGPFYRFIILAAPTGHELLYNFHHVIIDGWSLELLRAEFTELYECLVAGRVPKLKPVRHDYADFAGHHLRAIHDPRSFDEAARFWTARLAGGLPQPHEPPPNAPRKLPDAGMGYGCRVDQSLRDALGALASTWNTTLPVVLFTAFLRLVRRFHASNVVGAYLIHAGRDHAEFLNTVGVFVNPLLVISGIDDRSAFEQAVRQIHGEIHALLSHQAHPMEYVSDRLGLPSYTAPFAFNMLNIPNVPEQKVLTDFGDYRKLDLPTAKFSMELYVVEYSNGLELFFSFNGKHYDMPMIEYICGEYVRMIGRVAAGTSSPSTSDGRKTLNLPGEASRPSNCDDRN